MSGQAVASPGWEGPRLGMVIPWGVERLWGPSQVGSCSLPELPGPGFQATSDLSSPAPIGIRTV